MWSWHQARFEPVRNFLAGALDLKRAIASVKCMDSYLRKRVRSSARAVCALIMQFEKLHPPGNISPVAQLYLKRSFRERILSIMDGLQEAIGPHADSFSHKRPYHFPPSNHALNIVRLNAGLDTSSLTLLNRRTNFEVLNKA